MQDDWLGVVVQALQEDTRSWRQQACARWGPTMFGRLSLSRLKGWASELHTPCRKIHFEFWVIRRVVQLLEFVTYVLVVSILFNVGCYRLLSSL
jgi:hypothetical protein